MTGCLRKKHGKFYMILTFKNERGEWKQKQVATGLDVKGNTRKAEKMLKEYLSKHNDSSFHECREILFIDYIRAWLENKRGNVENNTWLTYSQFVENYIIPYFGPKRLKVKDIKAKHIIDFYDFKSKNGRLDGKDGGVSTRTLKYFSTIFSQVFKKAVLEQIIEIHPSLNVPLPKHERKEKIGKFLEAGEAQQLITLFEGHVLKPIVVVTLYYGLRRGEALGLKWSAVNFEKNTIEIKHTVVSVGKKIEKRDRTKNSSSTRTLCLIPEVKKFLLNLKSKQDKNRKDCGREYVESDYIFTWEDGRLLRLDYITSAFQKVLKQKGFQKFRFHDLRHSCASLLYEKGLGIKDIQIWLGHSDIKTTSDIYTHISQQRKDHIAKSLSGMFELIAG